MYAGREIELPSSEARPPRGHVIRNSPMRLTKGCILGCASDALQRLYPRPQFRWDLRSERHWRQDSAESELQVVDHGLGAVANMVSSTSYVDTRTIAPRQIDHPQPNHDIAELT